MEGFDSPKLRIRREHRELHPIMHQDWSKLPLHLLDSILERLELPSNYLRFSVVCKSWYCAAKDGKNLLAKIMSSGHYYPPMLLFHTNENNAWNLYSVPENKVLDIQLEIPNIYKRFCGSSKGWLIAMDDNFGVNLINPFLRMKGRKPKENSIIHLPSLTPPPTASRRAFWRTKYERFVYKAIITADPIINPDDCIVVVIYVERCRLAFIRLNKDISWTYMAEDYKTIEEVAYVDRKFYAVDNRSKVLCFDIVSQFNSKYRKDFTWRWTAPKVVHQDISDGFK
ncbi:PREDICTED: putative F-box protein At2g33200-like [Fragaria vesca subsp. vesca]